MGEIISLGWDAAGYSNEKNSVFVSATKTGDKIVLKIESLKLKDGFYTFPKNILEKATKAIIAIDAPFGVPKKFMEDISNPHSLGEFYPHDNCNEYAFRETDREIMNKYGKPPQSPVFAFMGRVTMRVVLQLRRWKIEMDGAFNVYPWDTPNSKYTAIEVYPGILNGKADPLNKSFLLNKSFREQFSEPLSKCDYMKMDEPAVSLLDLYKSVYYSSDKKKPAARKSIKKSEIEGNNQLDAAICALMGLMFAEDTIKKPNLKEQKEGKIYIPSPKFIEKLNSSKNKINP